MNTDQITNILIENSDGKLPQINGHKILAFVSFEIADTIEFRRIPILSVHGQDKKFLLGVTSTPFEPLPGARAEPFFKFKSATIRDDFIISVAHTALIAAATRKANL